MQWKKILPIAGAFVVYQFYKLYEFGTSIIWKPTNFKLESIGENRLVIGVTIQITNPQNRSLKIRGVDGTLSHEGKTLSTFSVPAFTIQKGVSIIQMPFVIDTQSGFQYVNSLLAKGSNVAPFDLKVVTKLPYFSTTYNEKLPFRDLAKIVI